MSDFPEFDEFFETKTVFSASYRSVEQLIEKYYGKDQGFNGSFELPAIEERGSGDGEDWEISISKRKLASYEEEYITPDEKGRYRNGSTRGFLNDLCRKDIIPAGNYLIDISW